MRVLLIISSVLISCLAIGQSNDTTELGWKEYIHLVLQNHPLVNLGDLEVQSGRAKLLKARGNFDPKLYADGDQKFYDEKEYFTLLEGGLAIPTWWGIEIKSKYNYHTGQFLNEQNLLPDRGLMELGIDVPLLQGLMMDGRRAQLKNAKLYARATEMEQTLILNRLLLEASEAYLKWQEKWDILDVAQQTLALADETKSWVKNAYQTGEVAAIDTVEAHIAWQNRRVELIYAWQSLVEAQVILSSFIWDDNQDPLSIRHFIRPQDFDHQATRLIADRWLVTADSMMLIHPELIKARINIEQRDIDVRLAQESLKPNLRLRYNPLIDVPNNGGLELTAENYKWGVQFDIPLFLRKGRGAYQEAKIQRELGELALKEKTRKFALIIDNLSQQKAYLADQLNWIDNVVAGYEQLVRAEESKFSLGESSIFLINQRQQKWRDAQVKRINVYYEWLMMHYEILAGLGRLPESLKGQ